MSAPATGITALGGLSGLLQGIAQQRNINNQNALAQQQLQNTANETALKAGNEGFQVDPTTGKLGVDPGYAVPGNPSYERAKAASQFKLQSSPKFVQDPPSNGEAWAMSHPGVPLPDDLVPYKDHPFNAQFNGIMKMPNAMANPSNASVPVGGPAQTAYEDAMGLPRGSMNGITQGKLASGMSNVAGQGAAAARNQNTITAQDARQANAIKSREDMYYSRGSPGEQATDTAVGKNYASELAGSQKKNDADMATIQAQIDKLKGYDQGALSKMASFLPGNKAVNIVDPDLGKMKQALKSAFTSSAKENFPGRMSQSEFGQFLESNMDPSLGTANMADSAQRVLDKMKATAGERQATANWFKSHGGHMRGFDDQNSSNNGNPIPPMRNSLYGNSEDAGPPVDPNIARAKAAAQGGGAVGVNGNVIPGNVVNQIKSMPDKGTQSAPQIGATKVVKGKSYKRTKEGWEEQP